MSTTSLPDAVVDNVVPTSDSDDPRSATIREMLILRLAIEDLSAGLLRASQDQVLTAPGAEPAEPSVH